MREGQLSLGIDTSNYKTSVAIMDKEGNILYDCRKFLKVKKGERGLRQSDALFQHVGQLPQIIEDAMKIAGIRENIGCVSVSSRPRPVEGSYMPVFTAGIAIAQTISNVLDVPLFKFSHQEGHIEAVKFFSPLKNTKEPFVCFHFSGGTTEAIYVDNDKGQFEIVGGSRDLAYGQVLDRIGVALGFDFPCGEQMDRLALAGGSVQNIFTPIKVNDAFVNLSGIETQGQRIIQGNNYDTRDIAESLLRSLAESVRKMVLQLHEKYYVNDFIFAGGVSSSQYIKNYLTENIDSRLNLFFGKPEMASDNGVGTALLGGQKIWH